MVRTIDSYARRPNKHHAYQPDKTQTYKVHYTLEGATSTSTSDAGCRLICKKVVLYVLQKILNTSSVTVQTRWNAVKVKVKWIYIAPNRETFNPLECRGSYIATSKIWSWYTGRWWVGCYIWCSEEGIGRGLAVPNVTAHPSTASVPITVLLYNGPLLCGFNVPVKRLRRSGVDHIVTECLTS